MADHGNGTLIFYVPDAFEGSGQVDVTFTVAGPLSVPVLASFTVTGRGKAQMAMRGRPGRVRIGGNTAVPEAPV